MKSSFFIVSWFFIRHKVAIDAAFKPLLTIASRIGWEQPRADIRARNLSWDRLVVEDRLLHELRRLFLELIVVLDGNAVDVDFVVLICFFQDGLFGRS